MTNANTPKFPKIEYNSIFLMEIIKIEDYDQLIDGLREIFLNMSPIDYLKVLDAEELLKNQNKQIFRDAFIVLPFISNAKFQERILPMNRVFFNLGDHIDHIQIIIRNISPSYILLDIRCLLNPEISDKLNSIIKGNYQSVLEQRINSKGTYNEYVSPERIKERNIVDLRYLIKKEATNFLIKYFQGKFMKSSIKNDDFSIIPHIDMFSLDFPLDNIEEWFKNNEKFFSLFSITFSPHRTFKYGRYLLLKEDRSLKNNLNYLVFARSFETKIEKRKKTEEEQKNEKINPEYVNIINGLRKCSFSLIAIEREIEFEELSINKIKDIISEEIGNLEKDDISDLLKRRENMFKDIFEFERFKIETMGYLPNISSCNFISLKYPRNKFSDLLKKSVMIKLEFMENITLKYSKYSQSNLELKNIDYNRKSQKRMLVLTIIVGALTLIQVIALLKGTDFGPLMSILNFLFF